MSWYSYYDNVSGLFSDLQYSSNDGALIRRRAPAGTTPIEGAYDMASQRVDVAAVPPVVVDYQPPAPPDTALETFVWNAFVKRWSSVPTLAALKLAKRTEIFDAAKANDQDDITVGPYTFHVDDASRTALYQALQIANLNAADALPTTIVWEMSDGTVVTLTFAQAKIAVRAVAARAASIRAAVRSIRAAAVAATTPAALAAIVWVKV